MPASPNEISEPNEGSSTISSTHATPFGAMRWTYTSSCPDSWARSA